MLARRLVEAARLVQCSVPDRHRSFLSEFDRVVVFMVAPFSRLEGKERRIPTVEVISDRSPPLDSGSIYTMDCLLQACPSLTRQDRLEQQPCGSIMVWPDSLWSKKICSLALH